MARARKPCEWCDGEHEGEFKENRNGFCMWVEAYPFNNVLSVLAQANTEDGEMMENYIDIPMKYCLNCGRKLI